MPIYAYRCAACGFDKDALQKMSDAPLTICPNCGEPELKKQVTAAGFQLKGSGWYVTDFRDGAKTAKGGDAPAKPGAETGSGDAKPADAKSGEASPAKSEPSGSGDAAKPTSTAGESKPAPAPAPAGGSSASSNGGSTSAAPPSSGGTGGKGSPSAPCSSRP